MCTICELCCQFQIFRKLSQEPVDTAMPSSVTPRQLTRLSWPASTPVRDDECEEPGVDEEVITTNLDDVEE